MAERGLVASVEYCRPEFAFPAWPAGADRVDTAINELPATETDIAPDHVGRDSAGQCLLAGHHPSLEIGYFQTRLGHSERHPPSLATRLPSRERPAAPWGQQAEPVNADLEVAAEYSGLRGVRWGDRGFVSTELRVVWEYSGVRAGAGQPVVGVARPAVRGCRLLHAGLGFA